MVPRPKLLLRASETTRANHEPVPNLVRRFGIRAARAALLLDSANPLAHAVVALPLVCGLFRAPCLVVVSLALAPFGKLFVFSLDCSSASGRRRGILLWSALRATSSGAEIGKEFFCFSLPLSLFVCFLTPYPGCFFVLLGCLESFPGFSVLYLKCLRDRAPSVRLRCYRPGFVRNCIGGYVQYMVLCILHRG
jgi:hypothetical protein